MAGYDIRMMNGYNYNLNIEKPLRRTLHTNVYIVETC